MTEQLVPEKQEEGILQLRLKWQDASDLPTLYANQLYISHAGGEFYLIFGEVQQPILTGLTPEELAEFTVAEVEPVAKLVVTPDAIVPIVQALAKNVADYQRERQRAAEGED